MPQLLELLGVVLPHDVESGFEGAEALVLTVDSIDLFFDGILNLKTPLVASLRLGLHLLHHRALLVDGVLGLIHLLQIQVVLVVGARQINTLKIILHILKRLIYLQGELGGVGLFVGQLL